MKNKIKFTARANHREIKYYKIRNKLYQTIFKQTNKPSSNRNSNIKLNQMWQRDEHNINFIFIILF